ncbi:hypothetical protein MMC12_007814 [Toensbergia leucococca]|nr:hypothetical protein [Toensbergia leucococca]
MRLFQYSNPDHARTGDVLLVRFKTGEPFAGVCLSIRKRGVDTGILLRNHVMRTGTELWVKVFSPKVGGVEVVQRAEKKVRRARLFYMRQPKHDRGSVDNVVQAYLGKRSGLRSGAVGLMDRKMKKDRKLRN